MLLIHLTLQQAMVIARIHFCRLCRSVPLYLDRGAAHPTATLSIGSFDFRYLSSYSSCSRTCPASVIVAGSLHKVISLTLPLNAPLDEAPTCNRLLPLRLLPTPQTFG